MRPFAHRVALALAVTGFGAFSSLPAASQTPASPSGTTDVKKALDSRKQELEEAEGKVRAIEQDVDQIRAEREKLNARLLETAAQVQVSEAKLTESEARLGELEAQEKLVRGSLGERHARIAKLLSALQRMGRNPPPVMITRREDALEMVRSAMLLSSAFPGMRTQALALQEDLKSLVAVMDKTRAERDRHKDEGQRHAEMKIRLAGLMDQKKQSLNERRAELDKVRSSAADIAKSVEDLNQLFQKLDQVARKSEQEAYEQELKRQAALTKPEAPAEPAPPAPGAEPRAESVAEPQPPPAPPAPEVATKAEEKPTVTAMLPPPKGGAPAAIELAPSASGGLSAANPGRIKPAIPFHLAHAKLPLPAQGRRVLSFGDKTQYGGNSKGIVIETRWNGQVTSPCDGWIVYAGEFRSYGQLLIINAGGGYHVLMAGLSQIDAQPGQFVLAAEPVGTMSGTPKSSPGDEQSGGPVLYVEFRKDGDPIDPDPWWVPKQHKAQNEQKVQG